VSDQEQNKALAKRFLDVMGTGDADTLMTLLSDDLEYWVAGSLPISGTHTKQELNQMLRGVGGLFPDGLKLNATSAIAEGNRVALEAVGGGPTSTGRVYANRYHFLFEFENGKISKLREYMDTAHAGDIFGG